MPFAVAAAGIGLVGTLIASDNAEDAANNATDAQRQAASDSAALGREQLAWDRERYAADKPLRDETTRTTLGLMQQQTDLAKRQSDIAADYDAYSKSTFRPLEQSIVADAQGYDTPARRAAAMAEARADVEGAYDGAMQGLSRQLGRTGQTLGSGRSQGYMMDAALTKAGAIAGATTGASRNVEMQGYARRMDAANLGRNLPSSQAVAAQTATGASNSAVSAGANAINNAAAGIGAMNQGYSGAIGAMGTAGSLYGQAGRTYQSMAGQNAAALAGFGNAVGGMVPGLISSARSWMSPGLAVDPSGYGIGGSGGLYGFGGGDFSSRKLKKHTDQRLDPDEALEGIRRTPVRRNWMYDPAKGGPDDGLEHSGPMAEDVARNMGEEVAPGGRMIDRVSMQGHLMAAVQALDRKVSRMSDLSKRGAA